MEVKIAGTFTKKVGASGHCILSTLCCVFCAISLIAEDAISLTVSIRIKILAKAATIQSL